MDLVRALRLTSSPCLALVGAGGKSTALFQLARQLSTSQKLPVLVTASTHLHVDQIKQADSHWIGMIPEDFAGLEDNLHGVMLLTGPVQNDRTTGLDETSLAWLRELAGYHDLPLLIEADGSRQHPLKAPADHEPVIPPFVDLVVVVAGLSAVGQPLSAETVHRPEIFARLSGLSMGMGVTAESLRRVLVDPAGGLKNIPAQAHRKVLLNQADSPERQALANELAHQLVPPYEAALVATLAQPDLVHAVVEPVAGILLAAGEARRFGQPKQLLDYHGRPFVRQAAETALAAGLEPVVVVTGANAAEVEAALVGIQVKISRNEAWQSGQSSSIRAGIQAVPDATGACIFLLADQPQVTRAVIATLMERHEHGLPSILAPWVAGKRANPVLFDRDTLKDLQALNGDVGGRSLFEKYPPAFMDWQDERLLIDVDTPADLETLMRLDT